LTVSNSRSKSKYAVGSSCFSEKISNGHLKELCHASGGDCGGTSIDNALIQMIVKILGPSIITLLKQEDPTAYLDLLREFETVKQKKSHKNGISER
jgi:hypothetical protein